MAIGELLGGAVQLFGSWCMFGGGAVVTTTGIGAIIGAPALAASVGLAGAGILNITSGVQNLIGALNSLSGGGGVSQGPAKLNPADKRVKLRKQTRAEIEANQPRNGSGQMIDPNTRKPLKPNEVDVGHKPGNEWRTRRDMHKQKGSTRQQIIDEENKSDLYHLEDRTSNRSHRYEKP